MAVLSRLGRYELRRVLGKGAMGVVYEGFDPTLGRRVAVKAILKSVAIDEETAAAYSARFVREAKAVGRLNHPHIVQVHDFGEHNEVAYLVMEYIEGRELRAFFDAGDKFEFAESVRIMGELLDALDFAHEAGVIHRDIKPANVMLDGQRRVKLADFGVARVQDGGEQSKAGTMVGTPAFMSPEQISGGKIDRRTDIFSAGTILYQLLTGEQPFKGEGAWTVAKMIMQDDPPRPSSVALSVSPVFDAIVYTALAKKQSERFASAKEFATALRGALGSAAGASSRARTIPPVEVPKPRAKAEAKASEAEVEFWRSIQNSTDPDELEFYLEQFPEGTYSQLARHKIAKLREPLEAARKEAEEQARLEAEERARREAEERAKREAAEKAKREAEAKAKREAEEKARREAEAKAKREAEEKAKREAEAKARREAEAKARRETEEKARREAEDKARREAQEKARREAEEKARQAQALARLKQQEEAAARARAALDEDATVALGGGTAAAAPPGPPAGRTKSVAIPAIAAVAVIVVGIGAYLLLGRTPAPVAQVPPVPQAAPPSPALAVDVAKVQRETEERVRKEFAEKAAAERAAMEKAVAEKAAAEKAAAEKLAQAKTAAEKAGAEKAAAKAAAERVAAEKSAAEKAAAEQAAAEKAVAEKAAAEKAAAEKAAAEKLAAEKAAAAKAAAAARKPGWPMVGDRWTYEAKDSDHPERKYEIVVEATLVTANSVTDVLRRPGARIELTHRPGAFLVGVGPGIVSFSPYLRAFQEIREGDKWSAVEFQHFGGCSNNPQLICTVDAQVVGRERVTVRAGMFDAWKIQLVTRVQGGRGGGTIDLTYWYSESARRMVKYQIRSTRPLGPPKMDLELVSYAPAGS